MSHSRATDSRSFLSCYLFCSPTSTDLSQAPEWSHMDSTSSVWQLCGHHLVCVIAPHRLHRNSPSSSRPPLLRSLPRCMCRAYASSHITNLTYLPHTLHRGLVVRFVIRQDLRIGPHPSFRSSSASVSYSANPAIISSARLYRALWCLLSCTPPPSRAQSSPRTRQGTGEFG